MRPNIDDHDYDTKMKKVFEFLEEGDKVKVTMRFRGREMAHGELGMAGAPAACRTRPPRSPRSSPSAHGRPPDADGARAEVDRARVIPGLPGYVRAFRAPCCAIPG